MGWLAPLLAIINRLLDGLNAFLRKLRMKKRQEERDALEADPSGWFGKHFGGTSGGGVPPVPPDAGPPAEADAGDRKDAGRGNPA